MQWLGKKNLLIIFIAFSLLSIPILTIPVEGCKNIIAVGDATGGEYNLLLKVRDPSRPGLQVLCIVPRGYDYTYHHPWSGSHMSFKVKHRFIGVATRGDTPPAIVKAGMALSDAGLAYGDADTMSNWKNPTKYAWDDFDWIRYACQSADNEEEAVFLMTVDAVDNLHASAVSENLFIVGPQKAYVVEADAFHYSIREINDDVIVMSNYPKDLWKTQVHRKLPISSSFDTVKERYVRKGGVLRLGSLYGIRVIDIGDNWVDVKQTPSLKIIDKGIRVTGRKTRIHVGERKTVGDFSVELLENNDNRAKIRVSYKFKAWENKLMDIIEPRYGFITVRDLMNWSRLNSSDLDGLRGMCEKNYMFESAMIYKIPYKNHRIMSSGWFAANHACSSIYIPVHICDTKIYKPYMSGEAAKISLELLKTYGYNQKLMSSFSRTENVFLNEMKNIEELAAVLVDDKHDEKKESKISDLLTTIDIGMQKQALLTEQIWVETSKMPREKKQRTIDVIKNIWSKNYSLSLETMENATYKLMEILDGDDAIIVDKIIDIILSICRSWIDAAKDIGKNVLSAERNYCIGLDLVEKKMYEPGFEYLQKSFRQSNDLLMNKIYDEQTNQGYIRNTGEDIASLDARGKLALIAVLSAVSFIAIIAITTRKRN